MKYCSPTANVIIVNAERILCQSNNAATAKRKAEIERERKAEKREELEQRESELVVEYGPFVQKLRRGGWESFTFSDYVYVFPDSQILLVDGNPVNFSDINRCELTDDQKTITHTTGGKVTTDVNLFDAMGKADAARFIYGRKSAEYIAASSAKEIKVEPTKTTTTIEHHYKVILYMKDIANPIIKINFSSFECENAHKLIAIVEAILAQRANA